MVKELILGEKVYKVRLRDDKSDFGSYYDDENSTLNVNFGQLDKMYDCKDGTKSLESATRILAHELGHFDQVGMADDEQTTVDKYENPIMRSLGDGRDRWKYGILHPSKRGAVKGPLLVPGLLGIPIIIGSGGNQ